MRQWGSSLDHNGMSVFFATVPAYTEFYHGSSSSQPINGTQWLAFEPEHALNFANCGRPGKGGPGRTPPGDHPSYGERPPNGDVKSQSDDDMEFVYSTDEQRKRLDYPRFRGAQSPLTSSELDLELYDTQSGQGRTYRRDDDLYYAPPAQDEKPCAGYLHT